MTFGLKSADFTRPLMRGRVCSLFFFWGSMKNENAYQGELIKRIKSRIPGSFVLKNDPDYIQGIPDLLILYKDRWAILEVKRSKNEKHRPNQDYYIDMFGEWSYASFVYPENEEVVLNELERALES